MEQNNTEHNETKMKGKGWIVALVIIIIGLVIIFGMKKKDAVVVEPTGTTVADTTTTGVNETDSKVPTGSTLNYMAALEKYKGKIIQFTADCQAIPDKQVFKVGTYIMLDNRAPKATNVKVGTTYTLGGYGFRIIQLNTVGTYLVDCGTAQNVSTVDVQK